MKKINLSSKAKKGIIITGSALICVAVAAIALRMGGGVTAADEPQSTAASSPSTSTVISVAPIIDVNSETDSQTPTFVPSSGASQSTQLTKIEKPTSTPPKPSVASGTNITNKSSKPSYSKPTASKSTTKPSTTKPKMGDKRVYNGQKQIYDDGFGWVEDGGGGGKGTTVEGDWGGGSQVGIMD